VFPTAAHLASWAGRCPGNNRTGGKRRSGKPTRGNRWLGEVLIECAWAAARSRDTYLSAQCWRLARRIGKKKAAVAVGHSILVIAWHLLTDNCDYQDLGGDYFRPARHRSPASTSRRPTPSPRLPRRPRTPRRLTPRGFTFQDEAGGSSPPRPTKRSLTSGNAGPIIFGAWPARTSLVSDGSLVILRSCDSTGPFDQRVCGPSRSLRRRVFRRMAVEERITSRADDNAARLSSDGRGARTARTALPEVMSLDRRGGIGRR
jgi:hypothetical protein